MKVVFDSDEIAAAIMYYAEFKKELDIKTNERGMVEVYLQVRDKNMNTLTASIEVNTL